MRYCQEKGIICQYAGTNMHCRLSACILPKESLYPTASDYEHKAATVLSTLQAENEKLRAELERAKRERDAAIKDIWAAKWVSCKHGEGCDYISAITGFPDCAGCVNWEWRGIKED